MNFVWLIDANALLNKANYYQCRECGDEDYIKVVTEYDIYSAPTISAVPVVHGRWVMMAGFPACSECGCSPANWEAKPDNPEGYPPYCHSCGAKMYKNNPE